MKVFFTKKSAENLSVSEVLKPQENYYWKLRPQQEGLLLWLHGFWGFFTSGSLTEARWACEKRKGDFKQFIRQFQYIWKCSSASRLPNIGRWTPALPPGTFLIWILSSRHFLYLDVFSQTSCNAFTVKMFQDFLGWLKTGAGFNSETKITSGSGILYPRKITPKP